VDGTREILLKTAEELIREQGLRALSMRALAARANYGKSTVHEAFGGTDQLIAELRVRCFRQMMEVCGDEIQPDVGDDAWRSRMFHRVSRWIIENPNWSEVSFVPQGVDERHSWTHPVALLLVGVLPEVSECLTEGPDSALMARTANEYGAAMVKTVGAVGDVDYGARVLAATFTAVGECMTGLIQLRAANAAPALTPK